MSYAYDITSDQYTDFTLDPITATDSSGNPFDFTGCHVVMKVRRSKSTVSTPALTLADGSGITLNGTSGITVSVTSAQLTSMAPGIYYYDIIVTDTAGKRFELLFGTFAVRFTVSQ